MRRSRSQLLSLLLIGGVGALPALPAPAAACTVGPGGVEEYYPDDGTVPANAVIRVYTEGEWEGYALLRGPAGELVDLNETRDAGDGRRILTPASPLTNGAWTLDFDWAYYGNQDLSIEVDEFLEPIPLTGEPRWDDVETDLEERTVGMDPCDLAYYKSYDEELPTETVGIIRGSWLLPAMPRVGWVAEVIERSSGRRVALAPLRDRQYTLQAEAAVQRDLGHDELCLTIEIRDPADAVVFSRDEACEPFPTAPAEPNRPNAGASSCAGSGNGAGCGASAAWLLPMPLMLLGLRRPIR